MAELGRVIAFAAGAALVLWVLGSAIRMVILPRAEPVMLTRSIFLASRVLFDLRVRRARTYAERDRAMARYAPVTLMLVPFVWVALIIGGFTGVFWGLDVDPLAHAFELAGSSLLTLGFVDVENLPQFAAAFIAATIGLGLVALLISFLPSIYASFQRRELMVARIATRAGDPPSATEMLVRQHRIGRLEALDELWEEFETWFADIEETHTSQPSLAFFRSITKERSWITAAGVILDTAALRESTLDLRAEPRAALCIRSGYLALRRLGQYFDIPFDADPSPDDPVSIGRDEFIAAYECLVAEGLPVKPDRDQCWRDFAGWRVNYDPVLLGLAGLIMAPYAMWSSDRSLRRPRPRLRRHRA